MGTHETHLYHKICVCLGAVSGVAVFSYECKAIQGNGGHSIKSHYFLIVTRIYKLPYKNDPQNMYILYHASLSNAVLNQWIVDESPFINNVNESGFQIIAHSIYIHICIYKIN